MSILFFGKIILPGKILPCKVEKIRSGRGQEFKKSDNIFLIMLIN